MATLRTELMALLEQHPGAGLELDPQELIKLAGARLAPIAQLPKEES